MNYVVCDLELTCWGDDQPQLRDLQWDVSEIIEIGAVKLDDQYQVIDEFDTFVCPVRFPDLTDFCKQLTGISQYQVDQAPFFEEAIDLFSQWADFDQSAFVSWGNDAGAIRRLCEDFDCPYPIKIFIDAGEEFRVWAKGHPGKYSTRGYGLAKACYDLDFEFEGRAHRGIDDARMTAKIFAHIRDPEQMSWPAKAIWKLIQDRAPQPTHRGHLKQAHPELESKWLRSTKELLRLGLVKDLGNGKGLVPM